MDRLDYPILRRDVHTFNRRMRASCTEEQVTTMPMQRKEAKSYQHIKDHPAYNDIAKMLAAGLNQTSIAWHLNNARPFLAPPYGHKEWTPLLVNNVYNCHDVK